MMLRDLLEEMEALAVHGPVDVDVSGLAYDSRRVRRGDMFFALPGVAADGRAFVRQAMDAGAVAAVTASAPASTASAPTTGAAAWIEVEEPRRALAEAAGLFHGHPARALAVVGVTGTNGKTTTTYLVTAILEAAGWRAALAGTTGVRIGREHRPSAFTTPEAPELQALLHELVERRARAVALELSSHALVQRRCFGLEPDVAVFTNLSHDHLDYHGTLERYLDAKLMLFDGRNDPRRARRGVAVINLDDPVAGRVLEAARRGGLESRTYGESPSADVRIESVTPRPAGLEFALVERDARHTIALPLLGRYNAWNAAAAFMASRELGASVDAARRGLAAAPAVPGRLEPVGAEGPYSVVVDYAHTPDALARALDAVREHAAGRVLLVFGCGGDRDRAKRPVMGGIASDKADVAWITNDNPRTEDPTAIAAEIRAGDSRNRLFTELDRRAAIAAALHNALPGDVVLIAGKGHETTQTIGAEVLPFDDRAVARELLATGGRRA